MRNNQNNKIDMKRPWRFVLIVRLRSEDLYHSAVEFRIDCACGTPSQIGEKETMQTTPSLYILWPKRWMDVITDKIIIRLGDLHMDAYWVDAGRMKTFLPMRRATKHGLDSSFFLSLSLCFWMNYCVCDWVNKFACFNTVAWSVVIKMDAR